MLDLTRLRILRSVVASGSVGGAASSLGYTSSAVSQHLAALQRETGLVLLERSGRGIRPTTAGVALAQEADALLARLGEAETRVAELRSWRRSSLSIAYFASVGSAWLPEVLAGLLEELPDVHVDLRLVNEPPEDPSQRADVQLLVARRDLNPGAGFTAHHLLDDPYVVVLRSDHELARHGSIELADLTGERLIDSEVTQGWCRQILDDAYATAGYVPRYHVEAPDYPTAIAFVAAGIGMTLMPALGATRLPPNVVALPVTRPAFTRSIYVIVRSPAPASAVAALHLLEQVASGGPDGRVLRPAPTTT
jgi:DNA-binding transcriptional LysR family regulator